MCINYSQWNLSENRMLVNFNSICCNSKELLSFRRNSFELKPIIMGKIPQFLPKKD